MRLGGPPIAPPSVPPMTPPTTPPTTPPATPPSTPPLHTFIGLWLRLRLGRLFLRNLLRLDDGVRLAHWLALDHLLLLGRRRRRRRRRGRRWQHELHRHVLFPPRGVRAHRDPDGEGNQAGVQHDGECRAGTEPAVGYVAPIEDRIKHVFFPS